MATEVTDLNKTLAMPSWTQSFNNSSPPEATVILGGSSGHSDRDRPCSGVAVGHKHGHMWLPKPQDSSWSLVATGAVDMNTNWDFSRATDPEKCLGSWLGSDITTNQMESRPPTSARPWPPSPLQIRLCPQYMTLSFALSVPKHSMSLLTIMAPQPPCAARHLMCP